MQRGFRCESNRGLAFLFLTDNVQVGPRSIRIRWVRWDRTVLGSAVCIVNARDARCPFPGVFISIIDRYQSLVLPLCIRLVLMLRAV